MKFGGVLLCQKLIIKLGNNKTFVDVMIMTLYDVILYFRLRSGRKK